MSSRPGVRLGVDVGTVRVGVAACDPDGILATPWRTLSRDKKKNSDLRIIVQEAAEREAVVIYVGLPQTLRGGESGSAQLARELAGLLAGLLEKAGMSTQVRLIDERLSSVTAHQQLRSAGVAGREQRKVVDQVAAVGILQHALEMEKSVRAPVGELVIAHVDAAETERLDLDGQ
ncbi:putative Holliday junction resolvase [Psychromicrobium silvestre]|uniref:Putative pre-16S rRNA nuclease n=1 Tax=Psychromicrobium silvestre TaxID=1645614 RepID=A0A7Y9S6X8_9MICC|nr:Holliday junction resolvase RuvX [Psychromicrobium silvestre]NYE94327.1 putative Holliday junction resolvase [Psychromicrobium silvestre]